MIDPRFYALNEPIPLGLIAEISGATLADPAKAEVQVNTCASLHGAEAGALAFCDRAPKTGPIVTLATACFVRKDDVGKLPPGVHALVTQTPRAAFSVAAPSLVTVLDFEPAAPAISPLATLEDGVRVMPGAVIGRGAMIGAGTVVGANAVIGVGVMIGRNCSIGPGAVIRCALLGDRVKIGANAVIGEAGFGVEPSPLGVVDVPQFGRAILQDDVSIGALSSVDRGAFDDTIVGLSTKLDNLVHVGHNCVLGRGVIAAAYVGISGSCTIGDFVMMGGRVGLKDNVKIGERAVLTAGSGTFEDVPAGEVWGGFPAKPRREWVRDLVAIKRLVESSGKGSGRGSGKNSGGGSDHEGETTTKGHV
jgi:UDP-3-O-[3-hydroxymyristoyl] glucosamine N-acyltransferase